MQGDRETGTRVRWHGRAFSQTTFKVVGKWLKVSDRLRLASATIRCLSSGIIDVILIFQGERNSISGERKKAKRISRGQTVRELSGKRWKLKGFRQIQPNIYWRRNRQKEREQFGDSGGRGP